MRTAIISFLTIIILAGCKFKAPNDPAQNAPLLTDRDSLLLGAWTTCASTSGDVTYMRNSCIKWFFQANHCGFVGLEQPTMHFDWHVVGDTLYVKNKIGNLFIENGKYSIKEQSNGGNRMVIISDSARYDEYQLEAPPR